MIFKLIRFMTQYIVDLYNLLKLIIHSFKKSKIEILSKNKFLKNYYENEKIFIFANGPSLGLIDINNFNGNYTMTLNNFYKQKFFKNFKSNFHVVLDPNFFFENVDSLLNQADKLFINLTYKEKYNLNSDKLHYIESNLLEYGTKMYLNIDKPISGGTNVTNFAICLAIYMGFKKIILLGADYTFDGSHFFDNYDSLEETDYLEKNVFNKYVYADGLDSLSRSLRHHYKINEYAKKRRIEIFNGSKGSKLDAYNFTNYLEHL